MPQIGSVNIDQERDLLEFEVPLCTSTPSSSLPSTRVTTFSNDYSRVSFQGSDILRNEVCCCCC